MPQHARFCHAWLPLAAGGLASPNHTAGLMEVSFQSLQSSLGCYVLGRLRIILVGYTRWLVREMDENSFFWVSKDKDGLESSTREFYSHRRPWNGLGWVLDNKTQQIKRSRICEFTLHLGPFLSAILFWPPSCAKAAQNGGCVLLTWFLITRPPRLSIQQDGRERKVELHPKSVNAAVVSFNSNWLIYREKIKSSKVNLWYRVACCY